MAPKAIDHGPAIVWEVHWQRYQGRGYDEYIQCVDLEARLTGSGFGGPFHPDCMYGKVMIWVKWVPNLVAFAARFLLTSHPHSTKDLIQNPCHLAGSNLANF